MTLYRVLVVGASYGSLLASKLLLAGHQVTVVCFPDEAEVINRIGLRLDIPTKAHGLVEIDSRQSPGTLSAIGPDGIDVAAFDLVCLAIQEPQCRVEAIRRLLKAVAASNVPVMSVMNMPPPPYLFRVLGVSPDVLRHAYVDLEPWCDFDNARFTLCSPDPQAFRPPGAPANQMRVSLPTNFKAARFPSDADTKILRDLATGIDAVRWSSHGSLIELPVKLKVHDSSFVPLAKWAMLLTGNYRCVTSNGPISIAEAVHCDIDVSRGIYEWVSTVCFTLGAATEDLVPFERYAHAAEGLTKPSSAARALFAGAHHIERVDLLVQSLAANHGLQNRFVDGTVEAVNDRLSQNRRSIHH
ncbi:2-dehydropantoate 2-reductase N-terminal domain-containing protein [Methylopila sp. M107]|uniref:2-dehydropantoate 2-reductase N-terminal domain-containing protein n=1 Tax=Methylopila sp. M107 TaxID=1101190 RepID=UPI0009DBEC80|nr:2-dehydropantoate 2-reductase N-terminal domain-containing protein [Methylopila sp. M107]